MDAPLRLDQRIPEKGLPTPDAALDAFLGWVADSGLTLYPHQEEAVLELFAGNHVVLDAPTGSGKSLVATALHFKTFNEAGRTWYTAPIKALVSEKFFALCAQFGAEHVGMMTGDGAVNRDAPIVCCTAEILANLALREGASARVDSVVMDEFHYYADRDRGMAWQLPLLTLPRTQFLLMSATLGDTTAIREDLQARSGRPVVEVRGAHRPVPLEFVYSMDPIHEALDKLVRQNRAPIYVVHFAQNDATEQAQAQLSVDWCTKEEKRALLEAVRGFRFHSPFGPTLRRMVLHGVGLHHAGLLPRYRRLVEKLAQQRLLKIICGTDTLGVGINVPIRTVLFTQLCKFDGEKTELLRVREFKQIAGRAGRAGFDDIGTVVAQAPAHVIENARIDAKDLDPKKRRKIVRAQPPQKGYRHWDETIFQQLVDRPPEPLESRFQADHGRLLALMQHAEAEGGDASDGVRRMLALVEQSHATRAEKEALRARVAQLQQSLEGTGVLVQRGDRTVLDPTLQHDFSLHHSLSLFLLDALAQVDLQAEGHHLELVTWVEAILENPRQVLLRQRDKARFLRIQELKSQGVPYEDRMSALEDVGWPKPNADFIYAFFNQYVGLHPWLSEEDIRPKSVVRDMAEQYTSFADYVKDLGLQRAEGVLLRYLSDAYKALVQNVPSELRTEPFVELLAWLRALLGAVDASLLTEWEELLAGEDAPADAAPRLPDVSADPKAFKARLRAELHALVRALSLGDWEEAAGCVRRDEDAPWGPADWEAAARAFEEEGGGVAFDHRARLAEHTRITPVAPLLWRVEQLLLPRAWEGEEEDAPRWRIEGRVDLRADRNPDGPLVEVVAVG
jgi:superfamily II RNA helicase